MRNKTDAVTVREFQELEARVRALEDTQQAPAEIVLDEGGSTKGLEALLGSGPRTDAVGTMNIEESTPRQQPPAGTQVENEA